MLAVRSRANGGGMGPVSRTQFDRNKRPRWTSAYLLRPGEGKYDLCRKANMTLTGAPVMTATAAGRGYELTGAAAYMTTPVTPCNYPVMVGAVFTFSSPPSGWITALGATTAASAEHYVGFVINSSGQITGYIFGATALVTLTTTKVWAAGQRLCVVLISWDSNEHALYVNGYRIASSTTDAGVITNSFRQFSIGALVRNSTLDLGVSQSTYQISFAGYAAGADMALLYENMAWTADPWRQFQKSALWVKK